MNSPPSHLDDRVRSILVFGADAMLVETRSKILENAGFKVVSSMSLIETERELGHAQIALLLLCHSLASVECEKAVDLALRVNPNIVILLLSAASGPSISIANVAIHCVSSPQKLLDTVRGLLAQVPN